MVLVHLKGVAVYSEPDSGATGNIMDEHQFKVFMNRTKNPVSQEKSKLNVSTFEGKLRVKGKFETTIIKNQKRYPKIIIVRERKGSLSLLCKQTLVDPGMLRINTSGMLKDENLTTVLSKGHI